jgi:hypothetical protein
MGGLNSFAEALSVLSTPCQTTAQDAFCPNRTGHCFHPGLDLLHRRPMIAGRTDLTGYHLNMSQVSRNSLDAPIRDQTERCIPLSRQICKRLAIFCKHFMYAARVKSLIVFFNVPILIPDWADG